LHALHQDAADHAAPTYETYVHDTYPSNGSFPASLPAVTARGRRAGTTDDQRIVIDFGVIVLTDVLMVMASSTARAVLPWRFEIEEI
jgi:hypothetical protein